MYAFPFQLFGYIFILIGTSQSQGTSSNKQEVGQYGGKGFVRGYNVYVDNPSSQVQSPDSTYGNQYNTNIPTNYGYNNADTYSNINKPTSYLYNNEDTYLNTPSSNYNPSYDASYNNDYEGYSQSYGNLESNKNPETQGVPNSVEYQSINVPSTFPIQTSPQGLQVSHQFGAPQYAVDGNNKLSTQIQSQASLQSTQSQNGISAPQASYAAQQQSTLNNVGNQNDKTVPNSAYTTAGLLSGGGDFSYGDLGSGGFGGFGGFNTDAFGSGGFGNGFGGGGFGSTFGFGGGPYQHLFGSGFGGKLGGFNYGSQKGLSSLLRSKKRS